MFLSCLTDLSLSLQIDCEKGRPLLRNDLF